MPSTRLPPLLTRRPPLSALEDLEVLEKGLQGVAMLAYGILRCASGQSTQNRILNLSPTQPQRRNAERQFVQQQSSHESSTRDRRNNRLLCRSPSLADQSTHLRLWIGPSLAFLCSIRLHLTFNQAHHIKCPLVALVAFLAVSVFATVFALPANSWSQAECSPYCWAERALVSTVMIGGFAALIIGGWRMRGGDGRWAA